MTRANPIGMSGDSAMANAAATIALTPVMIATRAMARSQRWRVPMPMARSVGESVA